MSREIKFRAWLTLSDYDEEDNDKDFHAMATKISVHEGSDIGFSTDHGRDIFGGDVFDRALDNGNVYEYEDWCLWEGRCELMQYTGLKDKNGVEIYEGDILQIIVDELGEHIVQHYEVAFEAPSFVCKHTINPEYIGGTHPLREVEDFEVIGNIYENPELLKQHNDA